MNHDSKQNGFTLIELMLAMGFVSMLLIAITMTVIQIGNIYNRGLTIKEVSQAGSLLSSELQHSLSESAPFDTNVNGEHYIEQSDSGKLIGGRLCIGQYSYIWNSGATISNNTAKNKYSGLNTPIRFVKVLDPNGQYCLKQISNNEYPDITVADSSELLTADRDQLDLAVHAFGVKSSPSMIDSKTNQQLYYITFVLGTNDQAALNDLNCKPPSDSVDRDPNFCSINEFKIMARAGSKIK